MKTTMQRPANQTDWEMQNPFDGRTRNITAARSTIAREKGRYLTQSYDIIPIHQRKFRKGKRQHNNATKMSEHTTITDRLRTVRWSDEDYPTGVVNPGYGISTFPLTTKAV